MIEKWQLAFMFINAACQLEFPSHCILFVDNYVYDYTRWHLLGIIGFYSGHIPEGRVGCIKAIEHSNADIDRNNLMFYDKHAAEHQPTERRLNRKERRLQQRKRKKR